MPSICLSVALGGVLHEEMDQQRDVLAPLAQRRDVIVTPLMRKYRSSRNFFSATISSSLRLVALIRRTSTLIGSLEPRRTTSPFSSTRSSLACMARHVADLVHEQRAAVGVLEAALALALRAGEGALHVPEELIFEDDFRSARRS